MVKKIKRWKGKKEKKKKSKTSAGDSTIANEQRLICHRAKDNKVVEIIHGMG